MNYRNLLVLPLAVLLVGCSSPTHQDSKTSQTTTSAKATVSSTQKKTKATSSTSSRTQTATTRSSKTARERASAANKSVTQPTATTRLAALNQQLTKTLGKQVLVPQVDGLTSGSSKLNMRYSGDAANYTIHYSVGQQAQPFNAAAVVDETTYATVTKTTYATTNAAAKQVGYRDNKSTAGLPTVDLGHQITAHIDAGAGQRYIMWNEGRWSLTVHANMMHEDAGVALAKQAVATFEQVYLPAPQSVGAITFDAISSGSGPLDQVIQWQAGKVVYQVKAQEMATAIKMAASMQ
ncbi:hypothetical protein [Lactiplantibacillus plantarum]|uniref:hypothetical protein n=1 Tax=Lactiplantibacillus plantarum TaxID=1590 RepID=UPI0007610614|nr:hypothetical protein [Lactiplantibacillus plantarum]MBO2706363.1 hypothetical protein [Lactiplantibacillus plantarum]MCG0570172.1 Lipoprotein [Lactiplantibacillus plantarum]MCG0672630.1 Lipoprotein [Lactiplantibacillus plantarum]MCG0780527.1 Lipoprotein [Lactiplantibacillus plantarum]MCG0810992.1 Lipoprotein [Lactiplantibacillus plantarum]